MERWTENCWQKERTLDIDIICAAAEICDLADGGGREIDSPK